ncbi:MAG: bifunctional diguanylate cyclase/phosphodiesterase [Pseudomonadota bacterium]
MRAKVETTKGVEVAAIAGLIAISVYAELQLSLYSNIAYSLTQIIPGFEAYSLALFFGAWMGLFVYVFARKKQLTREIAARERTEAEFEDYKISDPITGMPNRHAVDLVITQRLTEDGRGDFAVLGIELTNQDAIHSVHGDQAVREFRKRLASSIVPLLSAGDFVGTESSRLYVVSARVSREERRIALEAIASKMLQIAGSGASGEETRFRVSIVFSLMDLSDSRFEDGQWSGIDVLRRVDFLLHAGARKGNGALEVYGSEVEEELNRRALIEACLSDAISDQQIVPYFQPLIDLQHGRVLGLEVLSRWTHPLLGPVSPGAFIPIAQEVGLSHNLTLSVLRQACRAAMNWPADIKIAVNVSPTDLTTERAVNALLDVLDESGIDQTRIELEITENDLIEEVDSICAAIYRFKERGVSISIDDFGTGYSSLHHLRLLPFDKIKIDQSFVRDMHSSSESHKIVRTVIALAQSLGLQTTAEGIEGEECQEILQQLGCTIGQGFLFARPLPASEVIEFIRNFNENHKRLELVA